MIIGITGGLGTGKTTVAKMFDGKGVKILDADKLSHKSLKIGSDVYKRIVSYFGTAILNKDRSINKTRLAKLAFKDKSRLKKLNHIVHPFVIEKMKNFIKHVSPKNTIVIDAPLLVETGLTDVVDKLIVVKTDRRTQLSRCIKKRNLKKEEVMARIKNQMPLTRKISMADYVIDNSGTLKETKKQVDKIWREIKWI